MLARFWRSNVLSTSGRGLGFVLHRFGVRFLFDDKLYFISQSSRSVSIYGYDAVYTLIFSLFMGGRRFSAAVRASRLNIISALRAS